MNRQDIKKTIKISIFLFILAIVIGYTLFTSKAFIKGPEIVIHEPQNGSTFATSSIVIRGIAERSRNITLNGKSISIDDQGNFKENILLAPGYNAVTLTAKDKFEEIKEYRLELIYKVD